MVLNNRQRAESLLMLSKAWIYARGINHYTAYSLMDEEWRVLEFGDLLNMDAVMGSFKMKTDSSKNDLFCI